MAKVLVVDDDCDFCESLARYLGALGHSVQCKSNGQAGLRALLEADPDLILLDLRMPVMDGLAFLGVVRSYIRFRSHPVIVITGIEDEKTLAEIHSYGVTQILKKGSFEFAEVRRAVEAVDA